MSIQCGLSLVHRRCGAALLALLLPLSGHGQDGGNLAGHEGHRMSVRPEGVVMNENRDRLPRDCGEISRDYQFTIRAGRAYTDGRPGMIFGYSENELAVEPCSRLDITFVNEDEVRHQWMVHGLPAYLYPAGMFHLEASGNSSARGTFIVPGDDRTYLVHCDMAQHMEKGLRGQLVVGRGSGDLWSVAGVSDDFNRSSYLPGSTLLWVSLAGLLSFLLTWRLGRRPLSKP